LRFPWFKEEWKNKKFGEVAEFKVTNSFSRENLNYENGSVKNIHYGDIHTKFQTLFDITKETVPYINEEISINKISDDFYCKPGDLIFADASEDLNDIGKCIEILKIENQKLLSGLHTLLSRPKPNLFYSGFAGYLFLSKTIRTQIQREAQGAKVLGISVGRISKVELTFPTLGEQKKISSLLSIIDKRIQTQNKIIDQLKTLIKALKEKLFTQQLGFKKNDGDSFPTWNMKKLGEIATKKSSNISANSLVGADGVYKIYGATGLLKFVNFYNEKEEYISIVKDGAGVGRLFLCDPQTSVLGTLDIIRNNGSSNLKFLYYLLSTIDFSKYITGSTIPHIYYKDYSNQTFELPCLKEQAKIADALYAIDEKIKKEKKIHDLYEKQKAFLLSNLFI
jgi:type I restriction enzyme S subunit